MQDLKMKNTLLWDLIFLPYYLITEFIPSVVFAVVMQKYGEEQVRHLRGGGADLEERGAGEQQNLVANAEGQQENEEQ